MRYTTDPGADTSAQDYLADQGDNGAAKELSDIELNLELIHDYKPGDRLNLQLSQFPEALAQLQLYIEQSNAEAKLKTLRSLPDVRMGGDSAQWFEDYLWKEIEKLEVQLYDKALSTEEDTGVGSSPAAAGEKS